MDQQAKDLDVVVAFERAIIYEGDLDRAMTFAHPDITVREAPSTPYRSPIVGRAGLQQLREDVNALCTFEGDPRTEYLWVKPGVVIGRVERTAKLRSTGEPYDFRVTEWIRVRDGRVADVEAFYFDNAPLIRCASDLGLDDRGQHAGQPPAPA